MPSLETGSRKNRNIYKADYEVKSNLLANMFTIVNYIHRGCDVEAKDIIVCNANRKIDIPPVEVLQGFECVYSTE